ncbi:MAG: hypothetical protein ACLRO0_06220 [Massilimicrobiota timonensis]
MYKLSIDAIVGFRRHCCRSILCFIKDHADVELHNWKKELEKLTHHERIQIVDARDVVPMDAGIMSVRRKRIKYTKL